MNRHFRTLFGITLVERDEMRRARDYRCEICGLPESGKYGTLNVDHDHKTNKIRGLVCRLCNNKVLVTVERFSHLIEPAKKYLEKYASRIN